MSKETEHLLSTKANADRLKESIGVLESKKEFNKSLSVEELETLTKPNEA